MADHHRFTVEASRDIADKIWCVVRRGDGKPMPGAYIEGSADEFRAMAEAILLGESYTAKRCAAVREGDTYTLYSPRNAYGKRDYVRIAVKWADDFARNALAAIELAECGEP